MDILKDIDPEVLLSLIAAFGAVTTAVFIWVARSVVRYLSALLKIKVDQSVWTRVDWAARQAALATEKAFSKYLDPKQDARQRAAEKKAHALSEAKALLAARKVEVGDEPLGTAIEAAVATIPPPEPEPGTRVTAGRPTSLLPPLPPLPDP